MRFDPEGITGNPEIPFAKSMPDYIMRWLASRFLDADLQEELGIMTPEVRARKAAQEALMRGDTAGPAVDDDGTAATARTATHGGNGNGGAKRGAAAGEDRRGRRGHDRRAAGAPGEAAGPRPGPGLRASAAG